MNQNPSFRKELLRMAGIAGILAGLFVLTFAIVADSNGVFFYNEVFEGVSVEPWIQNVKASPSLSKYIMALPLFGFSCILIVALVLFKYIQENSWQKNLSLAGYVVGVPLAVGVFVAQLSQMNEVLLLYGKAAEVNAQLELVASLQLYYFHLVNHLFGPLFVILLGTTMMAWAALKENVLPKWICYWLIACGVMIFISFFGFLVPALGVAGIGAPLHMLGFLMLGVILLRWSWA
jgi:hypothetical protein